MSSSFSANTPSVTDTQAPSQTSQNTQLSWDQWSDNLYGQEKVVWRNNIPLVLSTSLATAAYSYFGIDGNTNNALNRSLLMALSTFAAASVTDYLRTSNIIQPVGNQVMYTDAALIPLLYYFITKRQFQLPDVNSQAIKTGVIASIAGQLSKNTVATYYNTWENPAKPTPTTN